MAIGPITGKQMRRLQTLWQLFARQAKLDPKDREARIGWVAGAIGRQIASFKEMDKLEAERAIGAIQKHLPAELLRRNRASRETARAYGTAGRKSAHKSAEVRMADAGTLQLLANLITAMGWTRGQFDAWLASSKSPARGGRVRTLADANRVIWALKGMLRRAQAGRPAPREKKHDGHQPDAGSF